MSGEGKTNPDEVNDPRCFTKLIAGMNKGDTDCTGSYEMEQLLKYLATEARTNRKTMSGEVTLKLTFYVEETGSVEIVSKVTRKQPALRTMTAVKWLDRTGKLIDSDPRQPELPLASVPGGKGDVRNVKKEE